MATIIKRKKAYSVVYNYVDENGETKQKWETVHTHKEALRRKAEVENTQNAGTFLPPNKQTVREFLHDFVATYGERKWSISMYDGQLSLISNYINPIIGDLEVQSITPRVVDKYIQTLQKTPSAARKNRKTHAEYVTNSTIERIFKLLRCAFKQAVRWELIGKNPFDNAILPKTVYSCASALAALYSARSRSFSALRLASSVFMLSVVGSGTAPSRFNSLAAASKRMISLSCPRRNFSLSFDLRYRS